MLQFLIGAATTGIFNICGTLLVDLNPECPSAASALLNLVRCSLSAGGLAVLQVMINHIGFGWCFTIFSALAATTIPPLLAENKWGMEWRRIRYLSKDPDEKVPQSQREKLATSVLEESENASA